MENERCCTKKMWNGVCCSSYQGLQKKRTPLKRDRQEAKKKQKICFARCGVRTHASDSLGDLKSSPLDHSGNRANTFFPEVSCYNK